MDKYQETYLNEIITEAFMAPIGGWTLNKGYFKKKLIRNDSKTN